MPDSRPGTPPRVGLPDPSTVVAELPLRPGGRGSPTASFPAPAAPAYTILRTNQLDASDDPSVLAPESPAAAFNGSELEATEGIRFQGHDRKAAKISISSADVEVFPDLAALIATLPAKSTMTRHRPRITRDESSDRVAKEERNIRVRGFLFAASREEDNDFHLIVCSDPDVSPVVCMNMELSGTPPASSEHFATLKAARDGFKAFFAANPEDVPGGDLPRFSYDFYDPPIPLEVDGSLFFDITHATGTPPGPQDLRPLIPVVWEIHPITKIVLEP